MGRQALVAITLLAMTGPARAQADGAPNTERYTLRAEVGLEYDTNAHRTEILAGADNPPLVASPLERLVLAGTLSDLVADGQLLTLGATAAGKIYDAPAATDEDVAIAQSSIAWAKALGPRATLTLSGAYYEAFQAPPKDLVDASERRDFRSLGSTVQLGWIAAERFDLSIIAGYRSFLFKPDRDDDFNAPTVAAELRWTRQTSDADWELSTGASFEHRIFGGPALTTDCPAEMQVLMAGSTAQAMIACAGPDTRHDDFLMSHLDLLRVGQVLWGAGYAFLYNRSNSYGETVIRHIATARFAAPLPGGFTLAARGELLLAFYSQPMIVGQGVAAGNTFSSVESIDDENRSSLRVDLSRDLGESLRLVARYTVYANEIANASPISYRRQTLLLSVTGAIEK
jgi:outer membrane scaffolding protein for murein synthesis (MipA/OmpV family)